MVYYKPVKVIINTISFAKIIIDVIVRYYNVPNLMVSD